MEVLKSILSDFSDKYADQIAKINSLLMYKEWAFTSDEQRLLTVEELKELIEKYDLKTVDPRSIQDFIDQYNKNKWYTWFPTYAQNGTMSWTNVSEIVTIVNDFLKTGKKNNTQNIIDYLSANNASLYKVSAAIVWNKLNYVAASNNIYSFRPDLFDGTYDDGNLIGTLVRNNREESPLVICLANLVGLLKNFITGTTDNADLLVTNTNTLRAACNYQFNKLNLKNIVTISDFWNSNVGVRFSEPFENLASQKELEQIKSEQKLMETELIDAMKYANFANASISLCNINQSIGGAILCLDSSKINISQSCTTSAEEKTISSLSEQLNNLIEHTDDIEQISKLKAEIEELKKKHEPTITFDFTDKNNILAIAVIVIAIVLICYFMYLFINWIVKRNKHKSTQLVANQYPEAYYPSSDLSSP